MKDYDAGLEGGGSRARATFADVFESLESEREGKMDGDDLLLGPSSGPGKAFEKKEEINHPAHYNMGKYEVIDVIEDWKLGFNLGSAVKYIARSDHKGYKTVDLRKALWYIAREIIRIGGVYDKNKLP